MQLIINFTTSLLNCQQLRLIASERNGFIKVYLKEINTRSKVLPVRVHHLLKKFLTTVKVRYISMSVLLRIS